MSKKTTVLTKIDPKLKTRLLLNLWNLGGIKASLHNKLSHLQRKLKIINEFMKNWKKKERSQLITLIKNANRSVSIEYLSGAYDTSNPTQPLTPETMHEILLELSSPLTGYLGREKVTTWKDEWFYFLRDLPVD